MVRNAESGIPIAIWGLLPALAGVVFLACGYLPVQTQLLMAAILLAILFLIGRLQQRLGNPGKIFLLLIAGFLTLRYWIFRITQTLDLTGSLDFIFALILFLAESYGILIHLFGMIVNVWPTDRRPRPLPTDTSLLPTVDVYIPTFDEPVDVVRITATAALQMRYPEGKVKVYILDDGGTRQRLETADPVAIARIRARAGQLQAVAAELGAFYRTREDNIQAKAGNINEALFQCECHMDEDAFDRMICLNHCLNVGCGQLVLVLDCDHVPTSDFLENTVGFFLQDPDLFLVQTPHYFINPGPVEKNLAIFRKGPAENEMFYGVIQRGLDLWNASFFCGSAAVLRRKHLLEVGGLGGETITEDVETSLKLHSKGFNSLYLFRPMTIGLSPETYANFILQRSRWAQGMVQLFRLNNPLFRKGLTPAQRLGYFNACFFWFFGLARVVFYLAPMFFLVFGMQIYNASLVQVAAYGLAHLIAAYYVANQLYGSFRHPFFSEFYETVQSIYLAPAIVAAFLRPHAPVFRVTPKAIRLGRHFLSDLALPFYFMAFGCLVVQVIGWIRWHHVANVVDALLLCSVWNGFNFFLLLCCLGVVWESQQRRKAHRFQVSEAVYLRPQDSDIVAAGTVCDLSAGGFFCRASSYCGLQQGSAFVLMAGDSYGNQYELPARVRHCREEPEGVRLGCEFELATAVQRQQAVAYVFGDSSRWRFFGQEEAGPVMSTPRGLVLLLWLGITSSLRNLAGVMQLVFEPVPAGIRQFFNIRKKGMVLRK
jgi:cellulose synthase (UDP-forming)